MKPARSKEERLHAANELLQVIASCGRRFFYHEGRTSRLERDGGGHVWLIDKWSGKRIYTHYEGHWRGFSEGGTLSDLVRHLRDFIARGTPVPKHVFGPWPEWMCNGDLWGYGEDMQKVRDAAERLELI